MPEPATHLAGSAEPETTQRTARDDYPHLDYFIREGESWWTARDDADDALDELDRLRASVTRYEEYLDRVDDWLDGMGYSMLPGRP